MPPGVLCLFVHSFIQEIHAGTSHNPGPLEPTSMHKADKKSLPSQSVHSFGGWVIDTKYINYMVGQVVSAMGKTRSNEGPLFSFSRLPCSVPLFSSPYFHFFFFFLLGFCLPPPPKSSPLLIPSNLSFLTPALLSHPSLPFLLPSVHRR